MGICKKCGMVMPTVNVFCAMCEEQMSVKLYTPRVVAYEKPELFDPVDMSFNDDENEVKENQSFVLPLCIEAVMRVECDVLFLVKEKGDKIIFAPRKQDAKLFHNAKEANEYIETVLKPKYGEKWSFTLWSLSALIK